MMGALGLSMLSAGRSAYAQDDDEYEDSDSYESSDSDYESSDASEEEESASPIGPAESEARPGKSHIFLGLRYRGIVLPKFMMNLFGEGGATIYVNSFGPELAVQRDDFEYVLSVWYANYAMWPTPFRGKGEGDEDWELVTSRLKVIYFSSDFLWSRKLNKQFSFNYGLGVGLGVVFGELTRQAAYPGPNDDPDDPYDNWETCKGDGIPDPVYCADPDGEEHYKGGDGYYEYNWYYGGSVPVVYPWLTFQTGLRWQPHPKFVARLDVGFGTSGFYFGLGADYGL